MRRPLKIVAALTDAHSIRAYLDGVSRPARPRPSPPPAPIRTPGLAYPAANHRPRPPGARQSAWGQVQNRRTYAEPTPTTLTMVPFVPPIRLGKGIGCGHPGLTLCLGLVLVVLAGAELFTDNNLIVMAWIGGSVSAGQLLRNWALVYAGNLVGSLATVALVCFCGQYRFAGGAVDAQAFAIANAKVSLGFCEPSVPGTLCNALVCLAIWLTMGAHSTTAADDAGLTWGAFIVGNLVPVTLGSIIGGAELVGAVYWFVYLREPAAR